MQFWNMVLDLEISLVREKLLASGMIPNSLDALRCACSLALLALGQGLGP
jgi:hypothetical protein